MNAYVALLRTPGVARIIAAQLTARFPSGMLSLGVLIHVESIFDSYGAAGLVLAATSVGQAVAGPLTSRWMGVWGMRPVLILTMSICATALTAVALAPMPLWGYILAGLVGGLSYPPVQPAVRTIYPKMVTSRQLTPLFSLDASAQEIIWISGPVVVTFIATQVSTVAGVFASVVFLVVGGIWFILSPEVGRVRIPRSKRRFGVVLARPPVLLSTVTGFLLIGACAAIETGVVATFGDHGAEAGIILAIWAIASLAGGLGLGQLPVGPWALARRMLVVFVGAVLAMFAWDFWSLAATLVVAGLCIAPALAVMFAIVSASVKFSDTAEAYGWIGTGQLIGAAIGSAIAGFLIDATGAIGASGSPGSSRSSGCSCRRSSGEPIPTCADAMRARSPTRSRSPFSPAERSRRRRARRPRLRDRPSPGRRDRTSVGLMPRALLIHGLSSSPASWWNVRSWLEGSGWSVETAALLGHGGRAPAARYTLGDYAADVLLHHSAAAGWDLVVGHSLGGTTATLAASRERPWARRLVLLDPVLHVPVSMAAEIRAQQIAELALDRSAIVAENPSADVRDVEAKLAAIAQVDPAAVARTFDDTGSWDVRAAASRLTMPTLVLAGDPQVFTLLDPADGETIASGNPHLELRRIAGAGHGVHRDRPDEVRRAIQDWLSRREPGLA